MKNFIDKISSLKISSKLSQLEELTAKLNELKEFLWSDRVFASEFCAKGGRKLIIDLIKDWDRESDKLVEIKKW